MALGCSAKTQLGLHFGFDDGNGFFNPASRAYPFTLQDVAINQVTIAAPSAVPAPIVHWPSRPDLRERRPSRLVAQEAEGAGGRLKFGSLFVSSHQRQ
jgi:hypothetical protein